MYSVALPKLVALNFVLEIKVQQPVGIPMVPTVLTLFLIVRQCYWIGGLREITGPSTVVERVIMGKQELPKRNRLGRSCQMR